MELAAADRTRVVRNRLRVCFGLQTNQTIDHSRSTAADNDRAKVSLSRTVHLNDQHLVVAGRGQRLPWSSQVGIVIRRSALIGRLLDFELHSTVRAGYPDRA